MTAHIIHVFPGFHLYLTRALKCLTQRLSHEKPKGFSEASKSQVEFFKLSSYSAYSVFKLSAYYCTMFPYNKPEDNLQASSPFSHFVFKSNVFQGL